MQRKVGEEYTERDGSSDGHLDVLSGRTDERPLALSTPTSSTSPRKCYGVNYYSGGRGSGVETRLDEDVDKPQIPQLRVWADVQDARNGGAHLGARAAVKVVKSDNAVDLQVTTR